MVRTNVTMNDEMHAWYTKTAEEIGISRSALMIVGLKAYMDSQIMQKVSKQQPEMISVMQQMAAMVEEQKKSLT